MDTSTIYSYSIPSLSDPVFIQCSTREQPRRSVGDLLIDHSNIIPFAQLYSPQVPHHLETAEDSIGYLPHHNFYTSTRFDPSLVLLLGDHQILSYIAVTNYDVFTAVMRDVKKLGCKRIIGYGYFTPKYIENTIYIDATSGALAHRIITSMGGYLLPEGRLRASIGLILGLAQQDDLPGICVLKLIFGQHLSEAAVLSLFKHLLTLIQTRRRVPDHRGIH